MQNINLAEERKAIEIAKNLLDVLDDETIAVKTGLDVYEIKKIRNELYQDRQIPILFLLFRKLYFTVKIYKYLEALKSVY